MRSTPYVSSPSVQLDPPSLSAGVKALAGLAPPLRLFLLRRSSKERGRPVPARKGGTQPSDADPTDADSEKEATLVAQLVHYLVTRPIKPGSTHQEALRQAAHELESTERKLDHSLAHEVAACHEEFLEALAECDTLQPRLASLADSLLDLRNGFQKSSDSFETALQQLRHHTEILHRFETAQLLVTLLKDLGRAFQLFNAHAQIPGSGTSNFLASDLVHLIPLQITIDNTLNQMAHVCLDSRSARDGSAFQTSLTSDVDTLLKQCLPALTSDVVCARSQGRKLVASAEHYVHIGLHTQDEESLTAGCRALLLYSGQKALAQRLHDELKDCRTKACQAFDFRVCGL